MKGTQMNLNNTQQQRIIDFAEDIFFDGLTEGGGTFVSSKQELIDLNRMVFAQGANLLEYLKDIQVEIDISEK